MNDWHHVVPLPADITPTSGGAVVFHGPFKLGLHCETSPSPHIVQVVTVEDGTKNVSCRWCGDTIGVKARFGEKGELYEAEVWNATRADHHSTYRWPLE